MRDDSVKTGTDKMGTIPQGPMTLAPWAKPVQTQERVIDGINDSTCKANGNGECITGATAPSEPFKCPKTDYEEQLTGFAEELKEKEISSLEAEYNNSGFFGKMMIQNYYRETDNLMTGIPKFDKNIPASHFLNDPDDNYKLESIEEYNNLMKIAEKENDSETYEKLCKAKNEITEKTDVTWARRRREALMFLLSTLAAYAAARAGGGGRGTRMRIKVKGAVSFVFKPKPKPQPQPPAQIKPAVSEPVSVANGEYLETWRDFLIPGVLPFDGARYMGLKLPDAQRWKNPLGQCQISAFDEYFSNPKRGEVVFHQADGKAIAFERPFNFLPSENASYPHLELKAPWLRHLRLKDRNIVKSFEQYDDTFYRLMKVEDLNGNSLTFHRDAKGVLWRIDRSDGLKLVFDNDAKGRRTAITLLGYHDKKLLVACYAYDARNRMISADCAFGMSVRYEWQANKPLLHRWHNLTRRSETVFTYDAEGRVLHTATSGLWNDDRFVYDSAKRETRYLPEGDEARTQKFSYDANENITAEVDALGGVVAHRYNVAGFRTATVDANGVETKTLYDIFGNVKKHTDGEGRRTTYGWGPDGQLDIVIDNLGNKKQYKHDDNSNVIEEIDAEGHRTRFTRDSAGRITRTVFADGTSEERSYYAGFGWLAAITDAKGGRTTFQYDSFGRVTDVTDPLGQVTRYSYEAGAGGFDVPTSLTRPDGVVVRRSFDKEGALASVTDGEGRQWTYRHGAFDVLEAIEDPRGGVLKLGYDSEGNLTSVINAMGRVYHLRRDVAGRIIAEEDFDGRVTQYKRDAGGRVIERIKPDGVRLVYTYDKTDLVTRVEAYEADAAEPSETVRYWYDGRGLLQTAQNRFARVDYERDKTGRIIEESCNGRRIKVRYDACGRRISRRVFSGIDQPDAGRQAEHLVAYVRDPLGAIEKLVLNEHEPLSFKRDALGRETRRESLGGFKLDSSYDLAGQLLRQEAGLAVHGYDGMRELQQLGLPPSVMRQVDRSYGWDKAFAPTAIKDGIWGETRFAYDHNGQVSEAKFGKEETENFSYDAARNIAGVRSTEPSANGLGQFLNWTSSPGGAVQVARGPKGEKITLHHDSCGRVIERIVERDGFRAKRWRYEWDAFDRLTLCVTPEHERWVYAYDPFGRRISKVRKFTEAELVWLQQKHPKALEGRQMPVDRGAWQIEPQRPKNVAAIDSRSPIVGTWFVWDGDVLCEEAALRLDGTTDWVFGTRWHFEEGTFKPLAKENQGGELSYIVTDHLGTPREMFSEDGFLEWAASFTTWGVVRGVKVPVPEAANDDTAFLYHNPSPTRGNLALKLAPEEVAYECPIRFQGQWQDEETGLYYNRHRYYDPLTAQYMSQDPIGLAGGDRLSGYVECPTVWDDPLGLSASNTPSLANLSTGKSWSTARSNAWKATYNSEIANRSGRYSDANLDRMRTGLAPMIKAEVRLKDGSIVVKNVPMELHHRLIPQRSQSGVANQSWNLTPATPWGHASMDPYRRPGNTLNKILQGTNSWTP